MKETPGRARQTIRPKKNGKRPPRMYGGGETGRMGGTSMWESPTRSAKSAQQDRQKMPILLGTFFFCVLFGHKGVFSSITARNLDLKSWHGN
ncbi:MAG: hypothetical protein AAGU02_03110, partial [Lawsonibacter sp.]